MDLKTGLKIAKKVSSEFLSIYNKICFEEGIIKSFNHFCYVEVNAEFNLKSSKFFNGCIVPDPLISVLNSGQDFSFDVDGRLLKSNSKESKIKVKIPFDDVDSFPYREEYRNLLETNTLKGLKINKLKEVFEKCFKNVSKDLNSVYGGVFCYWGESPLFVSSDGVSVTFFQCNLGRTFGESVIFFPGFLGNIIGFIEDPELFINRYDDTDFPEIMISGKDFGSVFYNPSSLYDPDFLVLFDSVLNIISSFDPISISGVFEEYINVIKNSVPASQLSEHSLSVVAGEKGITFSFSSPFVSADHFIHCDVTNIEFLDVEIDMVRFIDASNNFSFFLFSDDFVIFTDKVDTYFHCIPYIQNK